MAAKPSKSAATEEDRLRRDEELMRELLIDHKPQDTSDTWPLHLKKTFQSIETLGSIKYLSYDENAPAQHSTAAWRRDIKLRAKQLSDTAQRLLKECPSELAWRLELEKLVDARFRINTECPICSNAHDSARVWRSEVEVVTECNGPITRDLESRRERHAPCQCDEMAYTVLNRYFSNRADEAFRYDSDLAPSQDLKDMTKRRTDRVLWSEANYKFRDEARKACEKHVG